MDKINIPLEIPISLEIRFFYGIVDSYWIPN